MAGSFIATCGSRCMCEPRCAVFCVLAERGAVIWRGYGAWCYVAVMFAELVWVLVGKVLVSSPDVAINRRM